MKMESTGIGKYKIIRRTYGGRGEERDDGI